MSAPELELEVQPSESEWRVAEGVVRGIVAFARWTELASAPGASRQRLQAYRALDRWEILKPLLEHVRKGAVAAGSVVEGRERLQPFQFSEAAKQYLESVLEAAPRRPGEPGMPRDRTAAALWAMLGYVAAAYLAGRAFVASHANLSRLVEDWTVRSGERWLPILHRAGIVDAVDLFNEYDEPRTSAGGAAYERSQAPKLYLVDQTLFLWAAIRRTLDAGASVGAATAPVVFKKAVATPRDRPPNEVGRSDSSERTGLANAAPEPALPANRAPHGAPPLGGGKDPGRPWAALSGDAAAPATPPHAMTSPPTAEALEGMVSPGSIEDYGRARWSERFEILTGGAKPLEEPPAEWRQLSMLYDSTAVRREARARAAEESDEQRWRRAVRAVLLGRRVTVPAELVPLAEERLQQLFGAAVLPDEAATAIAELVVRKRPRKPDPEFNAGASALRATTGPPAMNAN